MPRLASAPRSLALLAPCPPRRAHALLILLLAVLPMGAGCNGLREMVGMKGNYLFVAEDALAVPGKEAQVTVRLNKGSFLDDVKGATVRFVLHDRPVGQAKTDDEGRACIRYTPELPGDYLFTALCQPGRHAGQEVQEQVLVAVRPAYTPLCVVDLDKTLVAANIKEVLNGKALPMDQSSRIMERLARRYAILYLTARPEYLGLRTHDWLSQYHFPLAPVYMSDMAQFLGGSRRYKSGALAGIRKDFTGPGVGIGNTRNDMEAYAANDLTPIYLVYISQEHRHDKPSIRQNIDDVKDLPPTVQVALDWNDIEAAALEGQKLPAQRAIAKLEDMLKNAPK